MAAPAPRDGAGQQVPSDEPRLSSWSAATVVTAVPSETGKEVPIDTKEENLGNWLFEGGVSRPDARRISARSEVLALLRDKMCHQEKVQKNNIAWIDSSQADIVFGVAIILYALVAGIDVEIMVHPIKVSQEVQTVFFCFQVIFMVVFIVELVLRIKAGGWRFCSPWHSPAGAFDTLIIVLGSADLVLKGVNVDVLPGFGLMRLLRILRLVRIFRVLRVCKELRLLFVGIASSVAAVFWSFLLLLVIMYLGTLVCVIWLAEYPSLAEYFGSVPIGLFTHFTIVTLEAWPDISDAVMEADGNAWAVYFMCFICITSLALMNLVTGVVCDKLMTASTTPQDVEFEGNQVELFRQEVEGYRKELAEIVKESDWDSSAAINAAEFAVMITRPDIQNLLERMEVSTNLDASQLFEILDNDCKGELTCDELSAALMRLRGSRHCLHSVLLQRDLVKGTNAGIKLTESIECKLRTHTTKLFEDLGARLFDEFQKIEAQLPRLHTALSARKLDEASVDHASQPAPAEATPNEAASTAALPTEATPNEAAQTNDTLADAVDAVAPAIADFAPPGASETTPAMQASVDHESQPAPAEATPNEAASTAAMPTEATPNEAAQTNDTLADAVDAVAPAVADSAPPGASETTPAMQALIGTTASADVDFSHDPKATAPGVQASTGITEPDAAATDPALLAEAVVAAEVAAADVVANEIADAARPAPADSNPEGVEIDLAGNPGGVSLQAHVPPVPSPVRDVATPEDVDACATAVAAAGLESSGSRSAAIAEQAWPSSSTSCPPTATNAGPENGAQQDVQQLRADEAISRLERLIGELDSLNVSARGLLTVSHAAALAPPAGQRETDVTSQEVQTEGPWPPLPEQVAL